MKKFGTMLCILTLAVGVSTGCGALETANKVIDAAESLEEKTKGTEDDNDISKSKTANKYIYSMVGQLVDLMDEQDIDGLIDIFMDELDDESKDNIVRFMNNYSHSIKAFADCDSFARDSEKINGISYDKYTGIEAIIITEDNAYKINFIFYYDKKNDEYEVKKMMIATGKSEAYENLDYINKDYNGYKEPFYYVDYHDDDFDALEEYDGYEVIYGEVVATRTEAREITLEEASKIVEENITSEELIERLGNPFAIFEAAWADNIYYAVPDVESEYILFKVDDDGRVCSCKIIAQSYPGYYEL
jgi:hypothetical protein